MIEKKKILFIVEAMGGGVFTYIVDLANHLIHKYDVYIAYGVREQTPKNYVEYFDERIQLIEVENFGRAINPGKDIKAFREIREIADKTQPDIIHLHSSKAGALGRWAFNGRKIPLFYTPHGYSFLMSNQNSIKRTVYWAIEWICGRRQCTTISCSEGEHKETLKLTKRAAYINNGINIEELQKLIESVEDNNKAEFTVFTLGRICYQKNPKLFNDIASAMPEIRFLWIGDGELRHELTAPNVEITGWVERVDALKYSLQGDVFVLTSLWEGLPISLLEAMYMKKVCIVSNVIGNRDVIQAGYNGFVCNVLQDYVEGIECAQKGLCRKCVENGYEDILTKYSTKMMANSYQKMYKKAIERSKKK